MLVMRKVISVLSAAAVAATMLLVADAAHAQVYKYRKKDGTVLYTDTLADLPPKIRAKYAKREAEKARRRARLEASLGKAEVARREAEAKRKADLQRQMDQVDQMRRRQELQVLLKRIRDEEAQEADKKKQWQQRVAKARADVQALFTEFKKTREAFDTIAVRADFTLFPGQAGEKEKLRKKLDKLEKELDSALEELNVRIPNEARRAGIPPGWVR